MPDSTDETVVAKEQFIFLDFHGKLLSPILGESFFLRIANLHKQNPLVQINQLLFKGQYDYSLGTNIFLDISENPESSKKDAFEETFDFKINPILVETKIISLKPIRIFPSMLSIPTKSLGNFELNLNWNYSKLLEKLCDGSLKIEDMIETKATEPHHIEELDRRIHRESQIQRLEKSTETLEKDIVEFRTSFELLEKSYERLKKLCSRPVRRKVIQEIVEECMFYKEAYEYHNIEKQILQPCDFFRTENLVDSESDISCKCIDIDRCTLYGLLQPSKDLQRKLSETEKEKLLTLENFDNLSLSARYYVIEKNIHNLEKYVDEASDEDLLKEDEFSRTPVKTLEIFRGIRNALKLRLEGIRYSLLDTDRDQDMKNDDDVTKS